jgi:D-alanyl-D-alanine carboxypeptidase/D-alanyl-D-alanine-endopeptidase (penicillin-binding protein 4)
MLRLTTLLTLLLLSPISLSGEIGFMTAVKKSNESKLFTPASVVKVPTALGAIEDFGLDYRFKTVFYKEGNDLFIKPTGDPFFTGEDVKATATALKEKGITALDSVTVLLYMYNPSVEFLDGDDTNNPYSAPTAAVSINFNTVTYDKTGSAGEAHTPLTPLAKKLYVKNSSRINVKTQANAVRYYVEVFDAIFKQEGVSVGTWLTDEDIGLVKDKEPFYTYTSPKTMEDNLTAMLKYSTNSIANQLAVALTYKRYEKQVTPVGVEIYFDSKMSEWLANPAISSVATLPPGVKIVDGSGLSRDSKLTPEVLYKIMERFKPYKHLLKEGRDSKTGTMRDIKNIAGYLKNENPYVLFCNDCPPSFNRVKFVEEQLNAQ